MIVACSACNTRFRVADEKVGPLGARIRCSRCGQTFQVPPPAAAEPAPPAPEPTPSFLDHNADPAAPPPAGPEVHPPVSTEPTGTGGWPTGVLEVAGGGSGAEPSASVRLTLESDPFAAFVARSGEPAPEPPPMEAGQHDGPGFLGSLPVTDLSALERTGAVPLAPPLPPEADAGLDAGLDDGLSLEDRTPTATPVREGPARWDEPSASQAIAVGPDGFQEVDLAGGAMVPDPGFDPLSDEATREAPLPPAGPEAAERPSAPPVPSPVPDAARERPAAEVTGGRTASARVQPERVRAVAMNVLSLAALLVVTLGIVLWWRGEGVGALLRWPRSGHADLDVGRLSSGVYEGSHGQPVVFVRGVVRATHEPVEGPVSVRVVLERSGKVLGEVTATAGAVARAEDLAAARSPEDLGLLRERLDAGAPRRLEPGPGLPFLAVLPVPDGDLGAIRFRVEPVAARGR